MAEMKRNILLGICGGIASYKSCEVVRLLVNDGFSVKVVMTESATKFVSPLVFQELSQNPVYWDMFTPLNKENSSSAKVKRAKHMSLSQWASLCVIAPLSANTLSKIAVGICDNLLTTIVCALAKETKVLLVPAMNKNMWENPIIQENIKKLKKWKRYIIVPPEEGELACGVYGQGRMPEPKNIYKKIKSITG
jgi:phosphopantothenoylcysteine decarboxylase/phosphopantothenate--cysteine ligase